MRNRWLTLPIVMACAGGLALAQPRVVINEFAYDDTGTDDLEFIELYNADNVAVDITGWVIDCGDQLTGDNNRDFVIGDSDENGTPDTQVILQPGQFYVLGTPNLAIRYPGRVNQFFSPGTAGVIENDNEWIALIIPGTPRTVVDAVAYETNRSPIASWVPADIRPQLGGGLWGNYQSLEASATTDDTFLTIGRWRDGRDTDVNGRDFGHFRPTPGASNNLPALTGSRFIDFNNYNLCDAPTDYFHGSYRNPRVIDPTQADNTATTCFNPNSIPASPQGGYAMMVRDWAGGGNIAVSNFVYEGDAGYDLYIYINPDNSQMTAGQVESWMIGVLGSPESVHNHPLFLETSTTGSANGMTGVGWVFRRSRAASTNPTQPTEVKLRLVDAGKGGDSRLSGPNNTWTIYGEIDLSSYSAGWYRLRLEVVNGVVKGFFYGDPNNPTVITGTTQTGLIGAFYIGYRETMGNNAARINPVRVDLRVYVPIAGDVDGNGCVDDADLLQVLFAFGSNDPVSDVNADGVVDDADLLVVLF
ncbi:MAG: lamin tail domain-containing protein, partial [Armatimonadota bacterium]|nr:lamin tail domain-containing protein [Armatimonadota bacterium]